MPRPHPRNRLPRPSRLHALLACRAALAVLTLSCLSGPFASAQAVPDAAYTVRPGDTAYSVARQAGTDVQTLLRLNGLSSADLHAGQVLRLPARTHTVTPGQTLYSVARLYGLKPADLQAFNRLTSPDLQAGQVLALPPGTPPLTVQAPQAVQVPQPVQAAPVVHALSAPVTVLDAPAPRPSPAAPLPAPDAPRHTVQLGQTLYAVARLYGVRPDDLLALNRLNTPDLRAGQVLLLPQGVTAGPLPALPPAPARLQTPATYSPGVSLPRPPATGEPRSDAPPGQDTGAADPQAGTGETPDWRALAMNLMGVPYVYGGASRSGTDCSGLVLQVFTPLGLNLPRQSAQQAQTGQPVQAGEWQPGDLLFFDTEGRGQVTHVGIYLGDGTFINANSYGGQVAINSLSEKYFAQRYLWARRVLGGLTAGR